MSFVHKYYARSRWAALLAASVAAFGCAGANRVAESADRIDFADLKGERRKLAFLSLSEGASVVHFKQGDRVPLDFTLDSSLAELQRPDLVLVVNATFTC